MKCPSKEIDKNNISLHLPKPQFLNRLFESQHSLCLFLLVVLWCFCSPWRYDVFVLAQAGWLRNTPVCPQGSMPVLFCLARLRGCRISLFLSDVRTHRYPLYCIPTCCRLCRTTSSAWCSVNREGVLWVNGLIAPNPSVAGSSFLVCPSQQSCFRYTLKSHMMHHSSIDIFWVSAALSLVLLADQEPWVNRGGFSSVLSQDRHHAFGGGGAHISSQWWWWVY